MLIFQVTFESTFGMYVAYSYLFTFSSLVIAVYYILLLTSFLATIQAGIEHISKLYSQVEFANKEQIKIMNGMHEGDVILSEPSSDSDERKILFSNSSAKKVLLKNNTTFISTVHATIVEENLHKERIFTPYDQSSTSNQSRCTKMSINEII